MVLSFSISYRCSETKDQPKPLVAPRDFEPEHRGPRRVEPEADAHVALQPGEVEIPLARHDLARVVEDRHFGVFLDVPAVFRGGDDGVAVAEPVVGEPAQLARAPE